MVNISHLSNDTILHILLTTTPYYRRKLIVSSRRFRNVYQNHRNIIRNYNRRYNLAATKIQSFARGKRNRTGVERLINNNLLNTLSLSNFNSN